MRPSMLRPCTAKRRASPGVTNAASNTDAFQHPNRARARNCPANEGANMVARPNVRPKQWIKRLAILAFAAPLAGCVSAAVGALNAMEPSGSVSIVRDLAYG